MKNNSFIIFFLLIFFPNLYAENIQIEAKNILIDKNQETSVFKDNVVVKVDGKIIQSDNLKYNKKKDI